MAGREAEFAPIRFSPMPRSFTEWVRTAQAFMLLTFAEHEPYPCTGVEVRKAIGETAVRHGADELGVTLLQLKNEHLKYLLETGSRNFNGIDSMDTAEVIADKFASGHAGATVHLSNG